MGNNKLSPAQFVKIEKLIDAMNFFGCDGVDCDNCPFYMESHEEDFACMAVKARFKLKRIREELKNEHTQST